MNNNLLEINNLHAGVEGKEILKGVNLNIKPGEIHVIMGPNGVGKSTLTKAIMNDPNYKVLNGDITFDGTSITDLTTDQRARMGLFLAKSVLTFATLHILASVAFSIYTSSNLIHSITKDTVPVCYMEEVFHST